MKRLWSSRGPWRWLLDADDGGGNGGGSDNDDSGGAGDEIADFEDWLKGQSEGVRKAFEASTSGLKSALSKVRQEAKDASRELKKLQDAQSAAEEQTLAEQKEFEKLATERKAKLDEVHQRLEALEAERDALKEQAEASEKALAAQIDAEIESLNLPDATKELLSDMTPARKQEWLKKHGEELRKSGPADIPRTPDGGGSGKKTPSEDEKKEAERINRNYRNHF